MAYRTSVLTRLHAMNPTDHDTNRRLSIDQLNAIDLLILGKNDTETAKIVGVSRQTVCDWRNNNLEFMRELSRQREALWGAAQDRLRSLVLKAVEVLERDMDAADDPRRQTAAAVHILRSAGIYGADLEPKPFVTRY